MAKAPGLYRPDGRPARQFGEEIVEPGEPFSGDTLSSIRALVSDETNLLNTPAPPSSSTIHSKTDRPLEPETPSEPHRDSLPDPHLDKPDSEIALNLPVLDASAEDHLRTMQAMQEAAAVCPPPIEQSLSGAAKRHPPQMPSVRVRWRYLVISKKGAPGRLLRSTLGRPRFWALAFLIGLILTWPWVIPFMVLTVAIAVILFVVLAGSDRVAQIAGWIYRRIKKNDPARAERLVRRGNRFLMRVPWLADALPLSWVEGFNMPQCEQDKAPNTDDAHLKCRLTRMAAEEVRRAALAKGT